jgi:hypothetical protein
VEDRSLEEWLYKDRPWLADVMKAAPKYAKPAMFQVAYGEAYFWTMADNMREAETPRARF